MILDTIVAETRAALSERKAALPPEALRERLKEARPPVDLVRWLERPGVSIIAEVKRASPSRGALNLELEPDRLARSYAQGGADAISVLTEPLHFHGRLGDLTTVRNALREANMPRPLLRKDFIVDPYQLLETRAWGADAVLLIVAALDQASLFELYGESLSLGLTPLVEVHDEGELARALELAPRLIGINNRDLHDFSVNLDVTRHLRPRIPPTCAVVSESGIREPEQMHELAALHIDAALIGEALVTASDPAAKLAELKEAGR